MAHINTQDDKPSGRGKAAITNEKADLINIIYGKDDFHKLLLRRTSDVIRNFKASHYECVRSEVILIEPNSSSIGHS